MGIYVLFVLILAVEKPHYSQEILFERPYTRLEGINHVINMNEIVPQKRTHFCKPIN